MFILHAPLRVSGNWVGEEYYSVQIGEMKEIKEVKSLKFEEKFKSNSNGGGWGDIKWYVRLKLVVLIEENWDSHFTRSEYR